jgi:hypothetical protein
VIHTLRFMLNRLVCMVAKDRIVRDGIVFEYYTECQSINCLEEIKTNAKFQGLKIYWLFIDGEYRIYKEVR